MWLVFFVDCVYRVPMTGRTRFMDVSLKQEESMAKEAYKQVMHQVYIHLHKYNCLAASSSTFSR